MLDRNAHLAEPQLMMPAVGNRFVNGGHAVRLDGFANRLELFVIGGNAQVQLLKDLLVIGYGPDSGHILRGLAVQFPVHRGFGSGQGIHGGCPGFTAQVHGVLFHVQLGNNVKLTGLAAEEIGAFAGIQLAHQQGGVLIGRDDLEIHLDTGLFGELLSQFHFGILDPVLTGHVGDGHAFISVNEGGDAEQHDQRECKGKNLLHPGEPPSYFVSVFRMPILSGIPD